MICGDTDWVIYDRSRKLERRDQLAARFLLAALIAFGGALVWLCDTSFSIFR